MGQHEDMSALTDVEAVIVAGGRATRLALTPADAAFHLVVYGSLDGDEHRRHRDPFAAAFRRPQVMERFADRGPVVWTRQRLDRSGLLAVTSPKLFVTPRTWTRSAIRSCRRASRCRRP